MLNEFQDLFEPGLGSIKGPLVHLYLKEDARPKFMKARPVSYPLRKNVSEELDRLVQAGILSPITHSE